MDDEKKGEYDAKAKKFGNIRHYKRSHADARIGEIRGHCASNGIKSPDKKRSYDDKNKKNVRKRNK